MCFVSIKVLDFGEKSWKSPGICLKVLEKSWNKAGQSPGKTRKMSWKVLESPGIWIMFFCGNPDNATMNPCRYSVATLQGAVLRDLDISKGFAAMVRRKMELTKKASDFPYTHEGLIENLNQGPLPDLYNVIYLTIKDTCSLNEHGYAVTTSKNLASKIWSTAYDWEALITGQKNPKQVLMGMTIHHITASKEVANYLHRAYHIISYYDIRMQNLAWENIGHLVKASKRIFAKLSQRIPASITMTDARKR